MIVAINILTKTKNGDVYDEVAINKFPIIVDDPDIELQYNKNYDEWIEDFIRDDSETGGICCLKKHIKNTITFDNSRFFMRFFDEDNGETIDKIIKISEKISLSVWKN